ncbi:hypothetical protein ACHWQZ_G003739 [Mnemiopsis leidyi]
MIRLIAVAACLAVALSDVAVPTLHDPIPEFEWGPRIFNGSDALEGEFPFMVRVLFSMNGQTSLCGGALISKQVVITAAHCAVLKDTSTPLQPDAFNIIVGDFNNQYNEHEQWLKVGRVIVHPEYNEATFQNDIALLVLADTYDDKGGKIGTINLPSDDKKGVFYAAGASITVIGWGGIDETGQIADNLQKLTYNVASRADCEAFWGSSINLHDGMMCTHIKDQYLTSHTWGGDSGGPLFASFEGTSYLLGLVSFGVAEPNKDALDVSTNVLFYLPWIHNITNEINGNDGDNSQPDNGTEDETTLDGGETDGETPDGGETDGETPDGGETDNETPDGGETDGETPDGGETDGETPDGGETDGETPDGGETDGETPDGGETDGETPDGGETDGETPDGGETDGETPDGGETDGETPDGGETDGETPDGGETDGETPDGGETDGETPDGGETDGETPDGGETDGETPDGGETDGETPDGGETDGETPDGGETDGDKPDGGETDNETPDGGETDGDQPDGGETDNETPDGGETDGETPDGGETDGETPDGGETDGETPDGGETDGETPDGGETDGETPDGGETDGEKPDGGETDGETPDGGETDGDKPDGGETDGEKPDGGETDGETPDGGETDGDKPDGGETDGETPDGGETDGETPDDSDKANFKLYLRGGSGEHEGIVHVHSNDLDASKAHTICNDRFDSNAAMSVCRHLGYRFGKLQSAKQFLNRDLAQNLVFSFENVWCDSADTDFSDCSMEKYMSSNDSVPCFYGEQAAVSCSNEKFEFEVSTFWNKMTYVKKAPAVKISSVCGADFTKFGEPIWIGGQASAYIFKVDMDGQAEVVNEKLKFKRRKGVFVGKSWTKVEYKTMEEARADTCLVCVVFLDDQPDIYASAADEKNCYGLEQATRSKSVKEAIEIWFGNQ